MSVLLLSVLEQSKWAFQFSFILFRLRLNEAKSGLHRMRVDKIGVAVLVLEIINLVVERIFYGSNTHSQIMCRWARQA